MVVVAWENRSLRRAQRVLGHWADNFDLAAREDDLLAGEEFARIEQAILTGNIPVLEEYGGVQAALKRTVELEQLARKRSHKTMIEGFATWESARIAGGGFRAWIRTLRARTGRAQRQGEVCARPRPFQGQGGITLSCWLRYGC